MSVVARLDRAPSNHRTSIGARLISIDSTGVTGCSAFAEHDIVMFHGSRNRAGMAHLGSTNWCTVFDVPPSGGGLKTCTATARSPIIPTFCAGPGEL